MSYGLLSGATLCAKVSQLSCDVLHARTMNEVFCYRAVRANKKGLTWSHDHDIGGLVIKLTWKLGTVGSTHILLGILSHATVCSIAFSMAHRKLTQFYFFSYSPVVVTPEKTQHCPYDTGIPLVEWYFLKISTLLLHAEGETPSE